MAIRLDKNEAVFRNELIFAVDAKAITLDHTLTNLYMLMRNNGGRIKVKTKGDVTFATLSSYFANLEKAGNAEGFSDYPEATVDWMRSNLVNLVSRGKLAKEKISSLRPVHIESYRIRNTAPTRDYNSADQIFLMLRKQPDLLNSLKDYLSKGWDNATKEISKNQKLDVDTVGILHLIKNVNIDLKSSTQPHIIRPILEKQAELFCEDILKLLVYKDEIPRNVFIEYLRTLVGFHLSLYTHKVIYLLPKMVKAGKRDIIDDWSIVADVTDSFDSKVSRFACEDMERTINGLYDYFSATFEINATQMRSEFINRNDLNSIDEILSMLRDRPNDFEVFYQIKLDNVLQRFKAEEQDDKLELLNNLQYYDTYFDKYVYTLLKAKGAYQYRYYQQFIDNSSMKNTDFGFMADGRSRKHPRRAVLGSRLLEALVHLLVLEPKEGGGYLSHSLSIDQLVEKLRNRYGIIINGLNESRFSNADTFTHIAFKENVDAFKNKLRQIGFYTDLSDAYILQKIRPRYKIES
jgi:hypothetical protein